MTSLCAIVTLVHLVLEAEVHVNSRTEVRQTVHGIAVVAARMTSGSGHAVVHASSATHRVHAWVLVVHCNDEIVS